MKRARRAYVDAFEFGTTLKAARDKEATHIGFDLVSALPNVRGEVTRKIAMVENTLLEHGCKARHFGTKRIKRQR